MKVSVIMPTYNRAEMLPTAIESFINQDYKDAELIILDNGSDDDSRDIISEYYATVPNIHYIRTSRNILPPNNFNALLHFTTGDLICHLHDDDRLLPNGLSLRVEAFKKDPSLQVLYAGWITNGRVYNATPPDAKRIVREEYINFLTMMFRKDVDMRFDTDFKYYYDWLLKIQCFQKYKVGYIPDPVVHYSIHLGQESVKCRQLGMNAEEEKLMRSKL